MKLHAQVTSLITHKEQIKEKSEHRVARQKKIKNKGTV
jgi:hypothetical protein